MVVLNKELGGEKVKANKNIRNKILINGLKYWEVAHAIGISPSTFTVWLRTELDAEKKAVVLASIEKLKGEKEGVS